MTVTCEECGALMIEVGGIKNTKQFICEQCFTEKVQYVANEPCEHEYDDKNGNKCIHCGEESINYSMKK